MLEFPLKPIADIALKLQSEQPANSEADGLWGMKAVKADQSALTGSGIRVALIDSGIDMQHPAFEGVRFESKDFTETDLDDRLGHGTHCAGIFFGRTTDSKRIGVAPGITSVLNAKIFDASKGGSTYDLIQALQWVHTRRAQIVSFSLGIDLDAKFEILCRTEPTMAAARAKAMKGFKTTLELFSALSEFFRVADSMVMIGAAGNESSRTQHKTVTTVGPPASSNSIISVSAIKKLKNRYDVCDFSNADATLSAPGENILSCVPGGTLGLRSGTSMAAPFVAGVAALLAQQLRTANALDAKTLRNMVLGSVTTRGLTKLSPRDIGTGLVQAPK